jgi:hypothetical protein
VTYATGLEFNVKVGKHLVLIPSYYSYGSFSPATGWIHAREPLMDFTFVGALGPCDSTDRSRVIRVGSEGKVFWVYRNRPEIACRVGPERWGLSLFAWDEAFYYSKYHGWTRNRFGSGARIAVNRRVALDVYYLHQVDRETQPGDIHGFGMTLELRVGSDEH